MTAEAVRPNFEPIVLEDDPAFDVLKEYQDELDYYYDTHPEDRATIIRPATIGQKIVGTVNGARDVIDKAIQFRDELYGRTGTADGKIRLHLKPVEEMKFLPDGILPAGDVKATSGQTAVPENPFAFGCGLTPDFGLFPAHNPPAQKKPTKKQCGGKKRGKKRNCCSCKDTDCMSHPSNCKDEKEDPQDDTSRMMDPGYIPDSLKKLF